MTFSLVDTHAHLDMEKFDTDRLEVICRAKEAGVRNIISVGIDLVSSLSAINLSQSDEGIFATAGFHPSKAQEITQQDIVELEKLAILPRVVAIGELGLDYHYQPVDREAQRKLMRLQLAIAERLELPVIIHCREAEDDLLSILTNWVSVSKRARDQAPGVIHCFNGDSETAQKYLDMGFYLSVGAYISYPSAKGLRSVMRGIPMDKLLMETDCPFLPPQRYRGRRNEPSYIPFTLQVLAGITGTNEDIIAQATTENATQLFRLE